MYLCLMYVCPDVSNSGGGDVPTSDVSKSAPSFCYLEGRTALERAVLASTVTLLGDGDESASAMCPSHS